METGAGEAGGLEIKGAKGKMQICRTGVFNIFYSIFSILECGISEKN